MKGLAYNLTAVFWLVPALLVGAGGILAILLVFIDQSFAGVVDDSMPWLFSGTPDAARTVLNTIATATITVVSISFSVTVIAMQQAATQYSTRVLRTFTSNAANQVVLGAYLGTFLYSLLVLRAIKSGTPTSDSFIPTLAVSFGILLAIVALGMLIVFINNISQSLQVSSILHQIKLDFLNRLREHYPESMDGRKRDPLSADEYLKKFKMTRPNHEIPADKSGFLIGVNRSKIAKAASKAEWVHVLPRLGQFVNKGEVLMRLKGKKRDKDAIIAGLYEITDLSHRRSQGEDVFYGLRQLIDLILKSLSPGINDQTSARYGVAYLGNAMIQLAGRKFPEPLEKHEGGIKVIMDQPTWEEYVNYAFDEVRYECAKHILVARSLVNALTDLYDRAPEHRRTVVRKQLEDFAENIKQTDDLIDKDRRRLLEDIHPYVKTDRRT